MVYFFFFIVLCFVRSRELQNPREFPGSSLLHNFDYGAYEYESRKERVLFRFRSGFAVTFESSLRSLVRVPRVFLCFFLSLTLTTF